MPEDLQRNPEELWQLDEHSPFPDEVEIVVFEDRPLKGYIRPKGNLNTPFTKDNIIEVNLMFLIAYIKSPFRKELCIGMYKTAIFFPKKDFHTVQSRFILENLRWLITYIFFSELSKKWNNVMLIATHLLFWGVTRFVFESVVGLLPW